MKKIGRLSIQILAIFMAVSLVLGTLVLKTERVHASAPELHLDVQSAILVEASTGKVLYEYNAKQPYPPASMTKMMTEYLILDAIANGKISWDDEVIASDYAHFMGREGGSRVYIAHGEKRTVRELFAAMAIYSANDATVMLAEHLAGSETNFVQMMNEKAKEFGMTNTHFVTSTGYPAELLGEYRPAIEGDHYMSAEDAAILGRRLILDHPEITQFTTQPVAYFREGESNALRMDNWNLLIPGRKYGYEGADGLKTGHTSDAKWCLTATAKRNGMRLVSVVMGAESEDKRFQETIKLLDYGFNNFELLQLAPAQASVSGFEKAPITKGKQKEVDIVTEKAYTDVVRKGEEELYAPHVEVDSKALVAPIKKGKPVGTLTYQYTGDYPYRYLTAQDEANAKVNMVAEKDVEKAGWLRLLFRAIGNLIVDLFNGIKEMISSWLG